MSMKVLFQRCAENPDLPLPTRATEHAAGYDVRSAEESVTLQPGEMTTLFDTRTLFETTTNIATVTGDEVRDAADP